MYSLKNCLHGSHHCSAVNFLVRPYFILQSYSWCFFDMHGELDNCTPSVMRWPIVFAFFAAHIIAIVDNLKSILRVQLWSLEVKVGTMSVDHLVELITEHPFWIDALIVEIGVEHNLNLMPIVLPLVPSPLHLVANAG